MHARKPDDGSVGATATVWRVINFIMAVFFLLASLVNVNDDDWFLWVPIYLIPALLCVVVALNPHLMENSIWSSVCVVHFALCFAYGMYQFVLLLQTLGGQVQNPLKHEEGREMSGLFIILAWLGFSRFTNIGRPGVPVTNQSLMSGLLLLTVTLAILPLFLWLLCFVSDWHTRIGHCNGMFAQNAED